MNRERHAKASTLWIDLERISVEAYKVELGRLILTVLASVLYALGWMVGKVFILAALVARWILAAAMIGWRDARIPTRRSGVG